ncbi:hypothetical protein [Melghirimyces algeriensis]|uniref:Uncharacterized protein n=1 Tax=Melghirimyces algeriensis TaxID=910412 RepID=A0A521AVL6_9BACL|nr:hypothetical protein [Melghirimyces algeriensis]SMO38857.1 hypothetical protein SAMN06264849_101373 [Melghirimyces algeriensis]
MRRLDIQIDIARELEGMDKEKFNQEIRELLEKYFELNSIHIRKEVHTVEVERLHLKTNQQQQPEEWQDVVDIEREPLVTEFDSSKESTSTTLNNKPSSYY